MVSAVSNCRIPPFEVQNPSQNLSLRPGERWFAAQTLPHRENRAQFNLERMGLRIFIPRARRTIRHARRLRNVLAPLFPGYVFLILDPSRDRWRSINGAIGVASLIMGAEQPMPVPHGVVEALIGTRESAGTDGGPHYDLEIGQKVRILSGPFAGALCELDLLDDRGRVRVLLEIMGGKVAANLDRSVLVPAA